MWCHLIARWRSFDQPNAHGAKHPRRVTQHRESRFRHCKEPLHGKVEKRPKALILAYLADRELVSAEHERVDLPGEPCKYADRRIPGGGQRLLRLLLPAPREALLRCATRCAASMHEPRAGLGCLQPWFRTREDSGGIATETDKQHTDRPVRRRVRADPFCYSMRIPAIRGAVGKRRKWNVTLRYCPICTQIPNGCAHWRDHCSAVPGSECG